MERGVLPGANNVVHSLALLGNACEQADVALGAQWLHLRFAKASPAEIRGHGREVRHLAGCVLASSKCFKTSVGQDPEVGTLVPTASDNYASPLPSELPE